MSESLNLFVCHGDTKGIFRNNIQKSTSRMCVCVGGGGGGGRGLKLILYFVYMLMTLALYICVCSKKLSTLAT